MSAASRAKAKAKETPRKAPTGGIDVLNCGTGHTEIRFSGENAIEVARAARIVSDMLRRGYVLFIEGPGGELTRVESFDEQQKCYIVADGPLYAGDVAVPVAPSTGSGPSASSAPASPKRGPGRPRKTALPMATTKVAAIARSAGG